MPGVSGATRDRTPPAPSHVDSLTLHSSSGSLDTGVPFGVLRVVHAPASHAGRTHADAGSSQSDAVAHASACANGASFALVAHATAMTAMPANWTSGPTRTGGGTLQCRVGSCAGHLTIPFVFRDRARVWERSCGGACEPMPAFHVSEPHAVSSSRMPPDDDADTALSSAVRAPSPLAVGCLIEVTGGPDAGKSFTVDGLAPGRTYIGQSATCEVRIADRTVSRRHAALELQADGVRLTDLGSTNGTHVNGLRVYDLVLTGGETVRVGDTVMRVHATAPVAVTASDAISFGKTTGASAAMRRIYPMCTRLAASDVPLIIEGETGTGKEVLAESIHEASARAAGPFVVLDCTAIMPSLAESMIFGHERGAFTGAVSSQRGMFEEATGGTLFIDEIGDLDIALQAKLLRAIERSEVRRVGGAKWTRVDVRIISATRRDLEREIQAGRFRDDLYFRLAVTRIELPPLRRREGDIALLARSFWRELGGDPNALDGDFVRRLEAYDWPGNVRQLRNAIARRHALGELGPLEQASAGAAAGATASAGEGGAVVASTVDDLIARLLEGGVSFPAARDAVVDELQRRYVEHVLAQHDGNVGKAAAASGIGRRYFQTIRGKIRRSE